MTFVSLMRTILIHGIVDLAAACLCLSMLAVSIGFSLQLLEIAFFADYAGPRLDATLQMFSSWGAAWIWGLVLLATTLVPTMLHLAALLSYPTAVAFVWDPATRADLAQALRSDEVSLGTRTQAAQYWLLPMALAVTFVLFALSASFILISLAPHVLDFAGARLALGVELGRDLASSLMHP